MKFRVVCFSIAVIFASVISLAADGNETVDLLKSPGILAEGGSYTSEFSPMADLFNPAANARQQRLSFNVNGAALFGDSGVSGYNGIGFNLGTAIPTRAGVISASGYILDTPLLSELNSGFQGGLKASFSKELYPNFLTGIGLNLVFGESISATADIGIIREEGDLGLMQNFKWAVVLGELGYNGFTSNDTSTAFTPGCGIAFDLVDTENIGLAVNADLSFPGIINTARLNIGADAALFDFAGLRFSSTADLTEILNNDYSALVPSFGIYFDFKTDFAESNFLNMADRGWSENDIRAEASASPMQNGLWAVNAGVNLNLGVVDQSAPEIELDLSVFDQQTNPGSADDGNEDIGDETSGMPDGDESAFLKGLPDTQKGTLNKNSKSLKTVSDTNQKNTAVKKNPGNINQGPAGEKIITYISPNHDGIKDLVEIPVKITDSRYIKGFAFIVEDREGNEVKRIENKEKRPENAGLANFFERLFYVETGVDIPETIRWDGIDDSGNVVPDGFYSFYMKAWDDNGNTSETPRYGIVIDNSPPSVDLNQPAEEQRIFSPNDDGNKDTFIISQSGSSEDLWKAVITNPAGEQFKHYAWKEGMPESFNWDGKDDKKMLVPDGVYFYSVESTDRAGNSVKKELANIIINTQSTPISITVDSSDFAPGVPGSRETITLIPDIPVKTGIKIMGAGNSRYRRQKGQVLDGRQRDPRRICL